MKKLYTLALATAVALGATAATPKLHTTLSPLPVKQAKTLELTSKAEKSEFTLNNNVIRKAVSAEQAYGLYIWSYYTPLNGGQEATDQEFQVLFDEESNESYIYDGNFFFPVAVDLEAATITISPVQLEEVQISASQNAIPVVFPVKISESEEPELVEEPVVISITADGLSLSEEYGFAIAAMNPDENAENPLLGYFGFYLMNEWTRYVESDYWTTIGDATYTDGIVYSMYVGEGEQPTITGALQRSVTDPGIMRLKNAWSAYFESGTSEAFVFDMTDPEFILVPFQSIGLNDQADGLTFVISLSQNSQLGDTPLTKEDFLKDYSQYNISLTDNTINFPGNSVLFNWPYSSDAEVRKSLYSAENAKPSTLVLPADWNAVDNIAVEGADAPVEYFNLQGVRVENPSNGLYIRRHGKNVTKVIR